MSRRTERAILGVLGFLSAVFALVIGVQLLAGDGSVDVATNVVSANGESSDPAGAVGSADSNSLIVTSTTVAVPSPSTSTTTTSPAESSTSAPSSTVLSSTSTTAAPSSSTTLTNADTTSTTVESSTASTVEESSTTETTEAVDSQTSTSSSGTVVVPGLTRIEREIVRLTNELRADPSGPLRRVGPTPECVLESDDIEFDAETGHPKPVHALAISEPVSLELSRDWSQRMADADEMSHRSSASQNAVYAALGIDWAVRGENVAWAIGYELTAVAQLFFGGWRESDDHYCSMMSNAYTHIGVGHVRTDGGKDFATQNFYRPR